MNETVSVRKTVFAGRLLFSPDGRRIVTVSSDKTARQYYAKFEDLLKEAISRLPVNIAPEDWELIRNK
jgi:hypothetical protein